jgi:hypothetical protein
VVEVGVGQEDRVEGLGVEAERHAVPDRFIRAALEHPAIDEDPGLVGDEQELGAGDGRGATQEVDLHRRIVPRNRPAVHPRTRARRIICRTVPMSRRDAAPWPAIRSSRSGRLDAPIDRVYEVISNSLAWPDWWPAVVAVDEIRPPTERSGVGQVFHFTFKGKLPYTLSFDTTVDRIERPARLGGQARGELEGRGDWTLREEDGMTVARYDWNIRTTRWWMNLLAPVAGGLFKDNHDFVMESGATGIRARLGGVDGRSPRSLAESRAAGRQIGSGDPAADRPDRRRCRGPRPGELASGSRAAPVGGRRGGAQPVERNERPPERRRMVSPKVSFMAGSWRAPPVGPSRAPSDIADALQFSPDDPVVGC